MRACAGPEPGSSMPHGAQGVCRARRPRDANGNAAQTGGLTRQVRQRMNRLGKPEHRARFCFFSKKKSRAGMRRFPITLEIQIPMGFNCGTLNPCSPKNPSPITALRRRFAPPRPPKPPPHNARHPRTPDGVCATTPPQATAFAARSASSCPLELPHCAHAQGQSRVPICRTVLEEHAAPAA